VGSVTWVPLSASAALDGPSAARDGSLPIVSPTPRYVKGPRTRLSVKEALR